QRRQVILHAARDRPAEQISEHHGEQDRLQQHIRELLRGAPHLQDRSPCECATFADECARTPPSFRNFHLGRAHTATAREPAVCSCSGASWPVRAKNTSSRLGSATATDSNAMSR